MDHMNWLLGENKSTGRSEAHKIVLLPFIIEVICNNV